VDFLTQVVFGMFVSGVFQVDVEMCQ
jgi:hypothetical protein